MTEDEENALRITVDPDNRWVKLAGKVNWVGLEQTYAKRINADMIHPDLPARTVIAAMMIKYKLNLSSNETVRQINENIYFQYFVRASGKALEQLTPTLLRNVRERFGGRDWHYFKQELRENYKLGFFDRMFKPKPAPTEAPRHRSVPLTPVEQVIGPQEVPEGSIGRRKHSSREDRQKKREEKRKKKKVKKFKKYAEYTFWTILFLAFVYSIIQLSVEAEFFKDSRKKSKKSYLREQPVYFSDHPAVKSNDESNCVHIA